MLCYVMSSPPDALLRHGKRALLMGLTLSTRCLLKFHVYKHAHATLHLPWWMVLTLSTKSSSDVQARTRPAHPSPLSGGNPSGRLCTAAPCTYRCPGPALLLLPLCSDSVAPASAWVETTSTKMYMCGWERP